MNIYIDYYQARPIHAAMKKMDKDIRLTTEDKKIMQCKIRILGKWHEVSLKVVYIFL